MTIAAGFRFKDGVILCADSQETVGHAKMTVPKLKVRCSGDGYGLESADDLAIGMAGAGNGPFIDKLIERMWAESVAARSFEEACSLAEESIKRTHQEYGTIFQPGLMPEVELIYGVKMFGRSALFMAHGPIVNEKGAFGSVGAGYYMADFLATKLHHSFIPKRQAVILAAYVLFQCKEHVDGCGGDSQIAVLDEGGNSSHIRAAEVNEETDDVTTIDVYSSDLLLKGPDLSVPKERIDNLVKMIGETIVALREIRLEALEKRAKMEARMKQLREARQSASETSKQEP